MQTVEAAGLAIGDGHPPRIMGVLNVSEESPYDPSVFSDPNRAARYVDDDLIDAGADIVDVGLASANKRFDTRPIEGELERLDTAVAVLDRVEGDAVFSIETRYAEVAEAALDRGFDMVNDVCGFADPEMPAVCRAHDAAVVKMASPPDLARPGAVEETDWVARKGREWAERADYVDMVYAALDQNGYTEMTIVDPAFGGWSEAKTLEDDGETFRRLREFRGLGRPVLVSINRKNFLRHVVDRSTEGALPASLAATAMAVERGAHVVRTHDVAATRDAARIGHEFRAGPVGDVDAVDGVAVDVTELDVRSPGEGRRHLARVGVDGAQVTAGSGSTRWFEVAGLGADEERRLDAVAADAGVSMAAGAGGTLLFGTVAGFERLESAISGETAALDALADCLTADTS